MNPTMEYHWAFVASHTSAKGTKPSNEDKGSLQSIITNMSGLRPL